MKLSIFFECIVFSLLVCSYEKTIQPAPELDEVIAVDFAFRYPGADIVDVFDYYYGNQVEIHFMDEDGKDCTTIYMDDTWMITVKEYNTDDFLYAIPRKVARSYVGTGIENENYDSDNSYVIEVSRNGLDKKQYEFCCVAPFADDSHEIDNLQYSIVIDEDGTLLTCSHSSFNRSVWWYDIRSSIGFVRNKYGDVPILGAVNDAGSNVLFIREIETVKTVTLRDRGFGFEWKDTRYPLNVNTVLPASVLSDKEQYEAAHPGQEFFSLSSIDCPDGLFYGLTFGTELYNTTIYSKAE